MHRIPTTENQKGTSIIEHTYGSFNNTTTIDAKLQSIETKRLIVKRSPPIPHRNNSGGLDIHPIREREEITSIITK